MGIYIVILRYKSPSSQIMVWEWSQLWNVLMTPLEGWACFSKCFPFPIPYWHLCCIYFVHCSLSLPQTWLLFRHGVLLLPTCLPGLESPQALRRINSNAVLSLYAYSSFNPKDGRKTINFLSHFHELMPDNNYKHLECFVMQC